MANKNQMTEREKEIEHILELIRKKQSCTECIDYTEYELIAKAVNKFRNPTVYNLEKAKILIECVLSLIVVNRKEERQQI